MSRNGSKLSKMGPDIEKLVRNGLEIGPDYQKWVWIFRNRSEIRSGPKSKRFRTMGVRTTYSLLKQTNIKTKTNGEHKHKENNIYT